MTLFKPSPTYARVQELRRWNPWSKSDFRLIVWHMIETSRPTRLWR